MRRNSVMERYAISVLLLVLTIFAVTVSSMPATKIQDNSEILYAVRERRQTLRVNRRNIGRILGPIIAAGDRSACAGVCGSYATNEARKAMRSRVRGPYPGIRNFRVGGTTFGNRYFQLFRPNLLRTCMGSFCDRITPPPPTVTTTDAPTTTSAATTAGVTTAGVTTVGVTTVGVTTVGVTTVGVTTAGVTTAGVTTAGVTTAGVTTAGVTTAGVTTAGVTTAGVTTAGVTTSGVTTSGVTTAGVTTAGVTTAGVTTGVTTGAATVTLPGGGSA